MLVREPVAAEFLGRACKTLQNDRINGRGPPFIKLPSGGVLYDLDILKEFVAEHTFTSTTEAKAARLLASAK